MWHQITTEEDAQALMHAFGAFHDGCIREMHLWGGYFVNEKLGMTCPNTPDLKCRLIVQRQWQAPATIEMLFDGVSICAISAEPGYDRIMSEATLSVGQAGIVWSPDSEFTLESATFEASSVVVAKRMWWRPIENGLGADLVFGSAAGLPDASPDHAAP
jgi:hypothetical protein